MKYCKRCVLPSTKPGVTIDADGICSACRSNEVKRTIDWNARAEELHAICYDARKKSDGPYDCIVPVSGGKDSVYQAWAMKNVYNMRVLAVCLAPHVPTSEGVANLNNLIESLGIDLMKITVKPNTIRELRRRCFLNRGEPNWAEHLTVFSGVARFAYLFRVPLVVWGEDIAVEFGGSGGSQRRASAEDLVKNDLIKDTRIQQFYDDKITERDVFFYKHPDITELKKRELKSIYLGYFHWWDGYKNYLKASEVGFTGRKLGPLSGNILNYDNIDEKLCEINIWFKFLKFGFWRPTDQACYQIWNERMTRAEAVQLVNEKQYEFPLEYLHEFLEFHDLTEDQFWATVDKYRNREIWHIQDGMWRLKETLV